MRQAWLGLFALFLLAHPMVGQNDYAPYHFTTLAGTPSVSGGARDGTGAAALFRAPRSIAVSKSGDLYVADTGNYAIRKITPAGGVTTYAGVLGSRGVTDGAADARFAGPAGLGIDSHDSLFVGDVGVIRWVAPPSLYSPLSSTITQTGRSASGQSSDGPGYQAGFISPYGVAVDLDGDVYIVDRTTDTVRKLSSFRPPSPPSGTVTTLAGIPNHNGYADGPAATAMFGSPSGIAIDARRVIYVADTDNNVIRKLTPEGVVSTLAGTRGQDGSNDGIGAQARFRTPTGMAVDDAGNIYVSDTFNHLIRRISPDGTVRTLAGIAGVSGSSDGTGASAQFNLPNGIAIDAKGTLYVADYGNNTIRVGTPNRAPVVTNGTATTRPSQTVTFTLAGSDPDGDRFQYLIESTVGGTASLSADQVTFTPAAGFVGTATVKFSASDGYGVSPSGTIRITVDGPPFLLAHPVSQAATANSPVTFSANATGTYQWQINGRDLTGATGASLSLPAVRPPNTGLYWAVCSNASGATTSDAAILGLVTTSKVIGSGRELTPSDVRHPNGGIFDQALLEGAAAAFTADPGQVTRLSYIDLDDDIVQVELSGPGTVSLTLDDASGPARPVRYNQDVLYMKGHAGIVVAGATSNTHLSIFSVGRANAFDPTGRFNFLQPISATNNPANNGNPLFQPVPYDGIADLAFVAILSADGKFGGLRTANVAYFATKGLTGVYAPGVEFTGPVYLGNITAFDDATPVLVLGSAADAKITGGDLLQTNGRPVQVRGLTRLFFTAGGDSHGNLIAAKPNQGRLEENGSDVTSQIVVNP